MATDASRRRTHLERIKAIFTFIEHQIDVFPKSTFKEIGLNPRTAEMWLKIIEYIQNQPRIRLIQTDHNLFVEKIEWKYQALMRRMSVDETVPFEQRLQYLTDYLKSLYAREKFKQTPKSPLHKGTKLFHPLNSRTLIEQILTAFETFALLDESFHQYSSILRQLDLNTPAEECLVALSKWQKEVLLNTTFQRNLKRILSPEFYRPHVGVITQNDPDFLEKLKLAKETIHAYYSYLHEHIADWFFADDSFNI